MIRNAIIKVTLDCNINCKYCYVQRNRDYLNTNRVMPEDVLKTLIKKIGEYLIDYTCVDRFVFYWHGGEPLIAGTSFFKESYRLQQKYLPKNITVVNTIQTNAIILNRQWIKMLKNINYGICLSLDGPSEINDKWRLLKNGKGTYQLVLNSLELLQECNIPVSVLAVITPEALPHGRIIYEHFRKINIKWMDFMYPFYSRIDNTLDLDIRPIEWGKFYKDVFDAWIEEGNPEVYIRMLHDLCMLCLGGKTSMCLSNSDCSYVITIDPSGNIYICDDLLSYTDSLLGNIFDNSLKEIEDNRKLIALSDESTLYGEECLNCGYFLLCKGGCTLFRALKYGDFHGKHYFCSAQRYIINYINKYFNSLLSQKVLDVVGRGRNAGCPAPPA